MKKFMIAGGLLGFALAMFFGYVEQSDWALILWRASVASFCGGLLFRWWARVWIKSVQEVHQQRLSSEAKLAQLSPDSVPTKS
jgi:hypothetical protein